MYGENISMCSKIYGNYKSDCFEGGTL